jgi:hypothetical protein
MAQVRIPQAAEPLLLFCRPWSEKVENACFSTYAEMVVFAAGCGFRDLDGSKAPQCIAFIEGRQPYPIDFGVFKSESQQVYPLVLMLVLATLKKHEAVRDEERMCRVLEDYAAAGFKVLVKLLAGSTAEGYHNELAQLLLQASRHGQKRS